MQALDDAVVARLRRSLATHDGNSSVTRFGDASARMDDLRRFLESLTKDNGQCVEFEHWIEEVCFTQIISLLRIWSADSNTSCFRSRMIVNRLYVSISLAENRKFVALR